MIELGDKVKDAVSGLEGIVVSEIQYLNGCQQFGIQAPFQDGKMPVAEYVDIGQLIILKKGVVVNVTVDPGGHQSYAPKKK